MQYLKTEHKLLNSPNRMFNPKVVKKIKTTKKKLDHCSRHEKIP